MQSTPHTNPPTNSNPLKVLITNNTLEGPAGTELYVLTVARFLLENGHYPIAYSTRHGFVANKLRSLGIPTLDDLRELTITPDIIHGHHHLDMACATTRFPRTPVISFCHGAVPWEESTFPPISRIYKYVTVSQSPVKRIVTESVPSDRSFYLPNFVDSDEFTTNFSTRDQRRGQTLKALVYGNYPHKALPQIEAACRKLALQLDHAGGAFGKAVSDPGLLLPKYDVIFASGKGAMDSLYCGAEVILSGPHGIGQHITSGNFSSLYSRNFGLATCCAPPTQQNIEASLKDARQQVLRGTRAVSDDNLRSMSHRVILPRLVSLYKEAISHWHTHQPSTQAQMDEELRALSQYLRFLQASRFNDQELERSTRLLKSERELARLRLAIAHLKENPLNYICSRALRKSLRLLSA